MIESLQYLVYILPGIGGISCFIFYRKLPPVFLRLGVFLLFAMISQIVAISVARHFGNNIIYYNVAIMVNYLLTYAVFRKMSDNDHYKRRILIVFAIGGVLILYFIIQTFSTGFSFRALTILNIAATFFSLLYFYQILQVPDEIPVSQKGKFYIASGFLVHHLASFSYWLAYEYQTFSPDISWLISSSIFLAILLYIILLTGIFVQLNFGHRDRT